MTKPRDIVLAQIRHQACGEVPYTFPFEGSVGERLDAHYGYILAPAKPLQPETPTENAVAIVEALTNV